MTQYDYIKQNFGNRAKLLYTGSLIYEFTGVDIYEGMKKDIQRIDTSDYPEDSMFGMPLVSKKVMCFMKDENMGKIMMMKFAALRTKMFSYKVEGKSSNMIK